MIVFQAKLQMARAKNERIVSETFYNILKVSQFFFLAGFIVNFKMSWWHHSPVNVGSVAWSNRLKRASALCADCRKYDPWVCQHC